MATVYGLHEIELRTEVDPEEYEQYFADEVAGLPLMPGWRAYLLRGDRGPRNGKYLLVFEVDSPEDRDRFFSAEHEETEELRQYLAEHPDVAEVWRQARSYEASAVATDYVVVAP